MLDFNGQANQQEPQQPQQQQQQQQQAAVGSLEIVVEHITSEQLNTVTADAAVNQAVNADQAALRNQHATEKHLALLRDI